MHNIIACELVSAVEKNTLSALKYVTDLKLKKLNIKWGGHTASTSWEYTDNNELISNINFPPIKADAKITNYMAEVYTGFALHEIGHNLCTQKDVWDKAVALERRGKVGLTQLLNALEDPRQEKELLSRCHFEGAKNVLEKLTAWAVDESIKNGFKADDPQNFSYCLNILAYIDMCEYSVPSIGSAEDLLVCSGKLRHDLETALIKLKVCKNTQDVLDLCIELMGQYSNQNQQNQGKGVSESSDDKSDDGSDDKSDESSDDKSDDGSDDKSDDGSNDESDDGSNDKSDDGSNDKSDDGSESSSATSTVNIEQSGEEDNSNGSISIDLTNQSFKNKEDYLQEDAKNDPDKKADGVEEYSKHSDLKAETYAVDQMVECADEDVKSELKRKVGAVDKSLKLVNVSDCSQTLARILKNPDRYGTKRHRDRGKLDARKLGKLCTNTPNMFHQPWKQSGTKTAVSLLIDTSSSMRKRLWGDQMVNNAKESINLAMILGNALHKVQVKYAVGCFPDAKRRTKQVVSISNGNDFHQRPYTILKDHNQNWMQSKKFIASQHGECSGGTPTHQAMMTEGLRLKKRPEDRKVMIIITDGQPNSIKRTQQAKQIMAKWGIEVVGLILCLYKIYADVDPREQIRLDEFVKDFDGCFDHFVVEGSAKDMIKKGLHDLNKILR